MSIARHKHKKTSRTVAYKLTSGEPVKCEVCECGAVRTILESEKFGDWVTIPANPFPLRVEAEAWGEKP